MTTMTQTSLVRFRSALTTQALPLYFIFLVTFVCSWFLSEIAPEAVVIWGAVCSQCVFLLWLYCPLAMKTPLPDYGRIPKVIVSTAFLVIAALQVGVVLGEIWLLEPGLWWILVSLGESSTLLAMMFFHGLATLES